MGVSDEKQRGTEMVDQNSQWNCAAKSWCAQTGKLRPKRDCRFLTSLGWDKGQHRKGHEECEPAFDPDGLRRFLIPGDEATPRWIVKWMWYRKLARKVRGPRTGGGPSRW